MKRVLRALAALSFGVLGACNHFNGLKYENFDLAMGMASEAPAEPPVYLESAPPADLPPYVVYAQVNGDFHGGSEAWQMREIASAVAEREYAPDFILFAHRGSAYAGSVTQHVGFGIYSSSPVYRPQATAWCCRLRPSTLGLKFDDRQMVTGIEDWARSSGLLEGDTLISLAGAEVKPPAEGRLAPWATTALTVRPDDDVKVIWIRPGAGRMEGVIKAASPPPRSKAPTLIPPKPRSDPNNFYG